MALFAVRDVGGSVVTPSWSEAEQFEAVDHKSAAKAAAEYWERYDGWEEDVNGYYVEVGIVLENGGRDVQTFYVESIPDRRYEANREEGHGSAKQD